MDLNELNKQKLPIVKIDKSLDRYKDMHLFQHKVDEANEMLRKVGLPKPELLINQHTD